MNDLQTAMVVGTGSTSRSDAASNGAQPREHPAHQRQPAAECEAERFGRLPDELCHLALEGRQHSHHGCTAYAIQRRLP
ncbi:MAG: hypothetical protein WCP28_10725 [Actinomycetes bacterium]